MLGATIKLDMTRLLMGKQLLLLPTLVFLLGSKIPRIEAADTEKPENLSRLSSAELR
jgi:hypothetical protein